MGFAYANEHIIQHMNNVKAPYNVNRLTQEVAVRALADRSLYQERINAILKVWTSLSVFVFRVSRDEINGGCDRAVSPLAAQSYFVTLS